jgi:putative mycofactocin binding protein MftB
VSTDLTGSDPVAATAADPVATRTTTPSGTPPFDLDAAWQLHPQVAVRPERFGALLYHFGTRRLSFVKNTTLLQVVSSLGTQRSARTACVSAGVGADEMGTYLTALSTLAASSMICERTSR